jgi:RES domain-containing protein
MVAFRIGSPAHPLLSGAGAAGTDNSRWNSRGRFVIYCAEHYATALVEKMAQLSSPQIPRTFTFIRVDIDDQASVEQVRVDDVPDWTDNKAASQRFGDRWYDEQRSLVLIVPSLVAPGIERNMLINERHSAFALVTASPPEPIRCHPKLIG